MDVKDRLKLVLDEVFGGDIDAMADAMGVHRTTLFRYKNGGDMPSARALKLLSERKSVSCEWVLDGGSDTIVYDQPSSSNLSECSLPVYRAPIMNLPLRPAIEHSGMSQSTAPDYVSPTRYWLRLEVHKDEALKGTTHKSIFETGDLILIETCEPRPAQKSDMGRKYFVLKRVSGLVFDKVVEADLKGMSPPKVYGIAILMQRTFDLGFNQNTGA